MLREVGFTSVDSEGGDCGGGGSVRRAGWNRGRSGV